MFDETIDGALARLIEQWNIAERRIKKAEHVAAGEVVSSAIFELRYAGRKLVDSVEQMLQQGCPPAGTPEHEKLVENLYDATEDCVKSKHDAIDAMMLFTAKWFARTEKSIGLAEVQKYFPKYIELTGMISDIQDKIVESRGNRVKGRDTSYDDIERLGYDEILALYKQMRTSEPRVQAEVDAGRQRERKNARITTISLWFGAVGTIVGIIGVIVGIVPLMK